MTATATKAPAAATAPVPSVTKLPLEGQALLDFVKKQTNSTKSRTALAREAGYVRTVTSEKGPKEQVMVQAFYDAVFSAQGVGIKVRQSAGKSATGETTVHASGILLIGKNYTSKAGYAPGDTFTIKETPTGLMLKLKEKGAPAAVETKAEPTLKPVSL
jgi:hypothetical protein